MPEQKSKPKWGLAKGKYVVPDNIDELNPEIEALFNGSEDRILSLEDQQILDSISEADPGKRSKALDHLMDESPEE
jgi:hypothetical protein